MPKPPKKILVVDDEPNMRTTLSDILADHGFDVATAQDGVDAINRCKSEDYDFVLMDVRMPGIDGVEAFRQIRESSCKIRFILMSAYGDDDLKHQVLRDGALAFLDKPLNLETVINLVTENTIANILAITADNQIENSLLPRLEMASQKLTIVRVPEVALELISQLNYDVVLIDIDLPTTNGLELYGNMKKVNPSISAIMICNNDDSSIKLAEESVRQTAYTYLLKPLESDALMTTVNGLRRQQLSMTLRKPMSE